MASKKQLSARTQRVMQTYLGMPPGVREQAVKALRSQMGEQGLQPGMSPELGAWAEFNSGSAAERQRSGSGPRYSISATASGERRKAGTSAGRVLAASRLIIRWPLLPQARAAGG